MLQQYITASIARLLSLEPIHSHRYSLSMGDQQDSAASLPATQVSEADAGSTLEGTLVDVLIYRGATHASSCLHLSDSLHVFQESSLI